MYIYEILNKVNDKRYIGQTIQNDVTTRWKEHVYRLTKQIHENPHLQKAWNKYGFYQFGFHIIEVCATEEEVFAAEIKWMHFYNTLDRDRGYNIASHPANFNALSVRKRKAKTQRFGESYHPVVDPLGNVHVIEILRNFARDHGMTQPGLRAMVVTQKSFHYKGWRLATPETIGIPYEDDKYQKRGQRISDIKNKGRKLNVLSPDGNIYVIDNVSRFAKEHGLSKGNLSNVLSGKLEQTKGWRIAP